MILNNFATISSHCPAYPAIAVHPISQAETAQGHRMANAVPRTGNLLPFDPSTTHAV